MDQAFKNIFFQMTDVHSKISSLFEELWSERNFYKSSFEDLSNKVQNLYEEINHLKKQNYEFKQNNELLQIKVLKCLTFLAKIDLTKMKWASDFKAVLENYELQNIYESEVRKLKYLNMDSAGFTGTTVHEGGSPVFKNYTKQEMKNNFSKTKYKVSDKKVLLEDEELKIGSLKKSHNLDCINSKKKKFDSKKSKIKSLLQLPKRSLAEDLKNLGTIKAESTFNENNSSQEASIDLEGCKNKNFSKQEDKSKPDNVTHELLSNVEISQVLVDNEDDFIWESPKSSKLKPGLKINNKRNNTENVLDDCSSTVLRGIDFDETYITSSIVQNCIMKNRQSFENNELSPLTCKVREKSPEYDFFPLFQNQSLAKSKEREELLRRMCVKCRDYYKDILEDQVTIDSLKTVLKNCSRHRDFNYSTTDCTPIGYWKPFLTATPKSCKPDNTIIR